MSKLVETIIDSCMLVSEGLVDDARRNLRNSGMFDEDSDYSGMLGDAVMELIQVFAKQGHSGASAMRTLELFDQVARRKPLTAQAWEAERDHLLGWLKQEGQLDGEHAMSLDQIQDFIKTSIGTKPMAESLIEKVVQGAKAADVLNETRTTFTHPAGSLKMHRDAIKDLLKKEGIKVHVQMFPNKLGVFGRTQDLVFAVEWLADEYNYRNTSTVEPNKTMPKKYGQSVFWMNF